MNEFGLENIKKRLRDLEASIGVWQSWTPALTGFSALPAIIEARYCLFGKLCYAVFRSSAGTSDSTTFRVPAPLTCAAGAPRTFNSLGFYNSGAVTRYGYGYVRIMPGEDIFVLVPGESTAWASSGDKAAAFQIFYEVE
jgi:hypothetical protein